MDVSPPISGVPVTEDTLATTTVFLAYTAYITLYILNEFVFRLHDYNHECRKCGSGSEHGQVPRRIHQIYYAQDPVTGIPQELKDAQQTCRDHNRNYEFTVWNESMVVALLEENYPDLLPLYRSYQKLESIRQGSIKNGSSVITRLTDPWGFSNDFIAASPRHRFMWSVVSALPHAKRWFIFPYATNMFSIGTMFFWGRYLNYAHKGEFYILSDYHDYIVHFHAGSWHHWDGHIIWFLFNRPNLCWFLLTSTCTVVFLICICVRKKDKIHFGKVYERLAAPKRGLTSWK
ncbi:CSH1-like protein [Mya arenaria]|uniref:CSH1-like protein n=1 Tax=Mya arenaria TaxID=6604 RepID=A0ABY7EX21_MYAAR|nr:CSH1-like protein [Mya arenaria]